jgi:hypothetical protein
VEVIEEPLLGRDEIAAVPRDGLDRRLRRQQVVAGPPKLLEERTG